MNPIIMKFTGIYRFLHRSEIMISAVVLKKNHLYNLRRFTCASTFAPAQHLFCYLDKWLKYGGSCWHMSHFSPDGKRGRKAEADETTADTETFSTMMTKKKRCIASGMPWFLK